MLKIQSQMKNIETMIVIAEEQFFAKSSTTKVLFKKMSANFWLLEQKWPNEVISQLKDFPFLILKPLKKHYLKVFLKNLISGKFSSELFKKAFFGSFLVYPFAKNFLANIKADAVLDNGTRKLLFYRNVQSPFIIKIFESYQNYSYEKSALQSAMNVCNTEVGVPKILDFKEDNLFAIKQQWLVNTVTLRQCPTYVHDIITAKVMVFMKQFYMITNVAVINTSSLNLENYFQIKDYLLKQEGLNFLMKFEELIASNKKVFFGLKHGDLNVDNILVEKNTDKIYLIDWGEGFEGLIITDLTKERSSGQLVFNELIEESFIEKQFIHTFEEQEYLDLYLKFVNKIYKRYLNKGLDSGLHQQELRFLEKLSILQ